MPTATGALAAWLRETQTFNLVAVGHRVVHGGPKYDRPVMVDQSVVADLERYVCLAPLHQPHNLRGDPCPAGRSASSCRKGSRPALIRLSIAAMTRSRIITLPQRFYAEGVRRYGFHGLSYEYIAARLREVAPQLVTGRVIVAHLGSGASMCALANGRCIESTMGFTADDGLPWGPRPGQFDHGVLLYLLTEKRMSPAAVQDLLYRESGLKGLSGISNDMRDLQSNTDPAAALAVDYFVYRIGLHAGCWRPRWAESMLLCLPPELARSRRRSGPASLRSSLGSAPTLIRQPMPPERR